jgi:hypothetical protein
MMRLDVWVAATVAALVFASCATASGVSAPTTGTAPEKGPAPGQIPVEKRAIVKFADGTVDEFTISEYDPSDITLLRGQSRFSASGALIDLIEFAYDEETRMITTKMTKDQENRLKTRIVYAHDEGTSRLIRETVVNKAGRPVSTYEYFYDGNGNVVTRTILNGNMAKLAETTYTYRGGLLIASKTLDGMGKLISISTNVYDRDGHLINQVIFNAGGQITRRIATVWQDGKEREIIQTTADGRLQIKVSNEYGPAGELLRKTVENYQGNSTQVVEFEYDFLPNGSGV